MLARYIVSGALLFILLHLLPTLATLRQLQTYERALDAFRSHVDEVPVLENGVYLLDEYVVDLENPQKEGRAISRDLFVQVATSARGDLAKKAGHNSDVIEKLLEPSLDIIKSGTEEGEGEQEQEGLTKQEEETLEEYSEYLEAEQVRFQEEYNTPHKRDLSFGVTIIDALLGTQEPATDDEKDR